MKKLLAVLGFLILPAFAGAQTITCSATGATPRQAEQYAKWLTSLNAQRQAQNPPLLPYANFSEHCADVMLSTFKSYVASQDQLDAARVAATAEARGNEIALPGHCAAAGLAAGCKKAEVACFVLSGNPGCI